MTWTLILFLHFGTPQQEQIEIAQRLTWTQCFMRGVTEMSRHTRRSGDVMAVRCEPVWTKAEFWRSKQ